jgi:hypothetical protein
MSSHKTTRRLVDGGAVAVDLCACGSIQLHLSSITLRIEVASFLQTVDVLNIARDRLVNQWKEGHHPMPNQRTEVA